MKRIVLSIVFLMVVAPLWGAKGQVKTNKVNFGLTGGSDADDGVAIDRPSGSVMQFKSGAGITTLAELITSSATSRTGITATSARQGATISMAGDSNVLFADAVGTTAGRSPFGACAQQMEWMTQHNPLLWESDIFNDGIGGDNSATFLARLDDIMDHPGSRGNTDPDILLIQVGGNDLIQSSPILVDAYIANMTSVTEAVKTSGTVPVLVNIMDMEYGPFVANAAITNDAELDAAILSYNTQLKILAEQQEVAYFDLNDLMGEANSGNPFYVEQVVPSGGRVHFSFAGQRHEAVELLNFLCDMGLVNSNNRATKPDFLRFDDPRIDLQNQGSLTDASNNRLQVVDDGDMFVNVPYRFMQNDAGGDIQVIEFDFFGTGVAIVAGTGALGNLDVVIDGGAAETVSMFRDAAIKESVVGDVVWNVRDLTFSTHTLVVDLKDNATTDEFWFMGLLVERGAMNQPIVTDFPTTVSMPALTIQNIDTSDDVSANLLEVTGDNSLGTWQKVLLTDTDLLIARTGSNDVLDVDTDNQQVGINTDGDLETTVHFEVADSLLVRTSNINPISFPLILARDAYVAGEFAAIAWAETVAGSVTSDIMGSIALQALDPTDGSLDAGLLFSVAVANALTPLVMHRDERTSFAQPVLIQGTATGIDPDALAPSHLIVDHDNQNIGYMISANDNVSGWLLGDADDAVRGGVIYNHGVEEQVYYWSGAPYMLQDEFGTTITLGSPGDTGTVIDSDTVLLVEDDKNCFVQIASTSESLAGILFADDASASRGSIIVNASNIMTVQSPVEFNVSNVANKWFKVTAAKTTVNESEIDMDFAVHSNVDTDSFFVEGSSGFVGIGDATPSNELTVSGSVDITGTLGIGTPTPAELFELVGTSGNTIAQITGAQNTGAVLNLYADGGDDNADKWAIKSIASDNSLQVQQNAVAKLVIDASGNVGIGDPSPDALLDVEDANFAGLVATFSNIGDGGTNLGIGIACGEIGTGGDQEFIIFFDGAAASIGGIENVGAGPDFFTASDRKKKRHTRMSSRNTRSIIRDTEIVDFEWIDSESTKTQIGIVAQQLYEIYPDAVKITTETKELDTGTTVSLPTTRTIVVDFEDGTTGTQDITVDVATWIPDTYEDVDWYWRPTTMIPVLMKETQRQQAQIDYLWGAVALLLSITGALIVYVRKILIVTRKLAKDQPITQEDLDSLDGLSLADLKQMKDDIETMKGN